jgi:charged multivesicular body protein 3
MEKDQFREM